jgi:transcriptional regulator GlxA family with amidase domain
VAPDVETKRIVLFTLKTQSVESKPLHELRVRMTEHLAADLSVPALARRVGMSWQQPSHSLQFRHDRMLAPERQT